MTENLYDQLGLRQISYAGPCDKTLERSITEEDLLLDGDIFGEFIYDKSTRRIINCREVSPSKRN